ncbi:MAG: alpha/beta hydrolase [Bacteroidaceae bacterium]|nr:alpha/beta hydrolase [Bacteroidaceae bacterium]
MRRALLTILTIMFFSTAWAVEKNITLATPSGDIYGVLSMPDVKHPCPLVIIIAGSGPTDMDGNTIGSNIRNNSLKLLAEGLKEKGIASIRYDKRGIGKSQAAVTSEEELRFEHYIDDAAAWADMFSGDERFCTIAIAGHSEGSLIGMVAAQKSSAVKAYISIAGCGRPAYEVLEEQLERQPEQVQREAAAINKELCEGRTVENVPGYLAALYRKSVQPYLISWFRYDPAKEIAKLKIPVLILQGDKDLQVSLKDAEKLYSARIFSSFYIIEGMNHVLKHCESNEMLGQLDTYQNPKLPIKDELIEHIARFLLNR